jgi:peptidoglycan hydrolase-like protein with peptidoglycan-binding domain
MLRPGKRQAAAAGLTIVVGLATVGWIAAQQIRSPARVAADTAPPPASNITVPVVRRTLSTDVVVRGTVRYGAPQPVVLATSHLKQAAGKQGASDIVTRPPRKGANLSQGRVAMSVDGRPVFMLRGRIPMHRDLGPGDDGPDVRQLERSLADLGFAPGPVDGRYDDATQAAVSAFYLSRGWDPFGPTDTQLEQLRTARATAAAARDAHLQAINAIQQAQRTPTAAEAAQARIDAVVARDAVDTSRLAVQAAEAKLATARAAAARAPAARNVAIANARRDQAVADADVATKQAALDAAIDDERLARLRINEVPLESPPSDREAASAAARQATAKVAQARADLAAATATADAARAGAPAAVQQAGDDAAQAARDVTSAEDELRRARLGIRTAESQARLAGMRARLMARPTDTAAMHDIAAAAAAEERRTNAEVARLAKEGGVQVPANEVVFLPGYPLRVDAVKAKRGDTVAGRVMDVTGATLAIDSSLSVSDRQLVHRGDRVVIEDQDLGITTRGTVREVADTPGTTPPGINRVDPSRYYLGITPQSGPSSLVGSSVKLTIAVKSSRGRVLAVPVSTLSVGGDGSSRVQIQRGRQTRLVKVVPGLAAQGLVEVRAAGGAELRPGDLVVVGSRAQGAALPQPVGGGP